jgi:hypothetical protein
VNAALVVALSLGLVALLRYEARPRLSPDGEYYLAPHPPRPYAGRWLLPLVLRGRGPAWWEAVSLGSTCLTALLVGAVGGWVASVLFLGLASTRTNTYFPVLTDQLGVLLLTITVLLPWPLNLIAACFAGAVNEKGPIFAAALTSNPALLLGLVFWLPAYYYAPKPGPNDPDWLRHPFREARKLAPTLRDPAVMLAPWGVALVGLFYVPALAVFLAYAQLLVAQDRARLYQWIGPAVCVASAGALPAQYAVPLVVAHWLNPWRTAL